MTNAGRAASFASLVAWSMASLALATAGFAAVQPAPKSGLASKRAVVPTRTAKPKPQAKPQAKRPEPPAPLDPLAEQAQQNAERTRLTERIAELRKQIDEAEKSRKGTATALARAERELADVTARLAQLNERQRVLDGRIAALERQRSTREAEIAARRTDLDRTSLALYANTGQDPLQLWLTGRDPDEPVRTEGYLGHVARAQADDLRQLQGRVAELRTQRQQADDEVRQLARQAEAERLARESLMTDRLAQRDALARLSLKIAEQRKSASALDADQRRLTRVVEELQRVIDRRAAQEQARREAARKRADEQAAAQARRKKRATETPADDAPRPPPVRTPEPEPDTPVVARGAFGGLKGALRAPTRGTVIARFGAPRGDGGASWKGMFFKTDTGVEVRSVAAGRVVFADNLRGFGNLIIVDHGDQYLSIYGNNDSLVKHAGDAVAAGDVVSLTGSSGGDDQTGLYFELRFRGRPFDPAGWLGGR